MFCFVWCRFVSSRFVLFLFRLIFWIGSERIEVEKNVTAREKVGRVTSSPEGRVASTPRTFGQAKVKVAVLATTNSLQIPVGYHTLCCLAFLFVLFRFIIIIFISYFSSLFFPNVFFLPLVFMVAIGVRNSGRSDPIRPVAIAYFLLANSLSLRGDYKRKKKEKKKMDRRRETTTTAKKK